LIKLIFQDDWHFFIFLNFAVILRILLIDKYFVVALSLSIVSFGYVKYFWMTGRISVSFHVCLLLDANRWLQKVSLKLIFVDLTVHLEVTNLILWFLYFFKLIIWKWIKVFELVPAARRLSFQHTILML